MKIQKSQKMFDYVRRACGVIDKGFSLVELVVALVILAIGLFSFATLFRVYSKQIAYIEKHSEPNMYDPNKNDPVVYRIYTQQDKWLRKLKVPAVIEVNGVNETSDRWQWEPNSTGRPRIYRVTLEDYNLAEGWAVARQEPNE